MKNRITQFIAALVLLMTQPFTSNAEVRNSLTVKNNTGDTVSVALVWHHTGTQGWTSKGWYKVMPYQELRTDLHDLSLDDNTMYVYAKSGKKTWSGNAEYRIDNKNRFEINQADEIDPKMTTAKFKSVTVGKGDKVFYIQP